MKMLRKKYYKNTNFTLTKCGNEKYLNVYILDVKLKK